MARKVTPSQLKSMIRQQQSKTNQAIRNYNNAVQNYNHALKRAVDDYNHAVRQHNARVLKNRAIIQGELRKLESRSTQKIAETTKYQTSYRTSSIRMNDSYRSVIGIGDYIWALTPQQERIYDLIEQENANNLEAVNAVLSDEEPEPFSEQDIGIGNQLANISPDLDARWKGAVFSLNPNNPDATRHFCTSAREIFAEAFEILAPDRAVFSVDPNCEKTEMGNATRRSKLIYLLGRRGMDRTVVQFADDDITNILELFRVLNDGTHGEAGRYSIDKLRIIKKRVESGIVFLCSIAA